MIDTLEQLTQEQTEGESVDAWHLVNRKEHPGRVRLRGRAITQTMLKSNKEKTIDPCDLVPESIVQAITKKVVATQQEEMKKHQEAQAASMIQTFAEMLSEVTGRSLINHGVPDVVIKSLKADIEEFFQLPLEEKKAYAQLPDSMEGYDHAFVVSKEHDRLVSLIV
ncbi:uncharacterized protein A4U43_C04F30010 [Asparagus officinalis]|uniref:Non-haem dioxygenase N-terminal domain-containing protein n=1 Tax=Asparagus officinalis TaxID=4686 RepID=A0A5P1F124_ASPOF|nr:uncharacterized protein A4U43_C04F12770 [Asparagus officinalis]ONK73342.1 uncharacterized protein A4U43_C04F30010 [Asparagus officinalis]